MQKNISIQSKKYKSSEWKAKKRARHEENMSNRANLNREKSIAQKLNNPGKALEAQLALDAISNRS